MTTRTSVAPIHHGTLDPVRRILALSFRPWTVVVIYVVLFALYGVVLHPWLTNWGTTAAEQQMALPAEPAVSPASRFTRAITINATPEQIWPWLLQIGQDRAGYYSNDYLENLFGGDIHNQNLIRQEWQQRSVGDRVPMAPPEYLGGGLGEATTLPVRVVEPYRAIGDIPGLFVLQPIDASTTRLFLREPITSPAGPAFGWLMYDPMHFVMEQRMLRGIKERAEGKPPIPAPIGVAANMGWLVAGLALLGLFLSRRRWWSWLLLPVLAVAPSFYSTGDLMAALAGFLAIGITTIGGLALGRRWWPRYALLAAGVALVLLLAPDSHVVFGLLFDLTLITCAVAWVRIRRMNPGSQLKVTQRVVST